MKNNKLKIKIEQSGLKKKFIAKQLNITYAGFKKKLDGKSDYTSFEIKILAEILKLTLEEKEEIFFN